MLKIALCIKDGVVVNTASYDEDTSQSWLEQAKSNFDEIIIIDEPIPEPVIDEIIITNEAIPELEIENE
jgi:hypothetical protein